MVKGYTAYVLDEAERAKLLGRFPPAYPDVIAHHVTYQFGVTDEDPLPPPASVYITQEADDGQGVQAFAITLDLGGVTTQIQPNFARIPQVPLHVTWSIDRAAGRAPKDSGWVVSTNLSGPPLWIPVHTVPTFIPFGR